MSQLDLAVFLVAGIVGAAGSWPNRGWGYGSPLAWAIIAVWALLRLVHAV